MNSNQQNVSATIYIIIGRMAVSAFIFAADDVLYGRQIMIEKHDETSLYALALGLLQQTIDCTPPSLLASISERGIVVSGEWVPDDMCAILQQATAIHASPAVESLDVDVIPICLAWLESSS